jgi:PAS domain S-box-containing protein
MINEFVPQSVSSQTPNTRAAEVICVLNGNGIVRFATPATAAFYGYALDQIIGRSALRFIAPESVDAVIARWGEVINDPAVPSAQMLIMMLTANGRRIPIRASIWRLPDRQEFLLIHHVVEHLRERLDLLYAIMAAVSSTLELDELLNSVLRDVQRLIPCDVSMIYILERDNTLRIRRYRVGGFDDEKSLLQANLPRFETTRIMRATGQPLVIADCSTDPRWIKLPNSRSIRSWLGAPLIHHGEFLGEINLDGPEPNMFTNEDAELVQALASQVAAALHNVRQFEDEQRRAKHYQALSDVSQAISQLELRSVLEVVYGKIESLMDASTFFIGLYDEEAGQVRLVGAYDHGQPSPDDIQRADLGLTGLVIRTRRSVIVHDSEKDEVPSEIIIDGEAPRSILMFPLITQDDVVGVITVQSYEPNAYSTADIDTLEAIAGSVATAVSNAQLYDRALERLTTLETLHQLSLDLAVTQNPDEIAGLVTRTALDLFQPDEVRLCLCSDAPWEPKTWIGRAAPPPRQPRVTARNGTLPGGLIKRVLDSGQEMILHRVENGPALQAEFGTDRLVHSAAVYPITRGGHPFAALALLHASPHFFRHDRLRALELLCMQAATAFENARYTVTLRRRLDEVTALQELARQVSSSYTLADILNVVVRTLQDVYECRGAWIALVDERGEEVAVRAATGLAPETIERARFRVGEYGAGQVVETGRPLYVEDTLNDPAFRVVDPGVRSIMIVPLTVRGRVIGALGLDGSVPNAFTPEHERVLNIAGGQIAAAIETISLLQQTRERANQLAVANASLEAQDALRRELVYQVSHDLRSPLQIVYGYADLMHNGDLGPVTETQVEILALMLKRTRSIERLTLDIMAAKPISYDMLELKPVDIAEMCRQAVLDAQMLHTDQNFTFVSDVPPGGLLIKADYNRLSRVFDNLIGNAVKFSPDGGTITVRAEPERDSRRVLVSIGDQGIGIAPDQVPYIFERFFRGDRKRFGGSGLGLYIVQQIIEAHRGQVWVTSEQGVGSTFTFALSLIDG